jgi:hypothetical protein
MLPDLRLRLFRAKESEARALSLLVGDEELVRKSMICLNESYALLRGAALIQSSQPDV